MLHADTVGSLLRPPELLAARERWKKGEIDAAALRSVEDQAIRGVVALQEEIGLPVVTDGEFRRENWWIDFVSKLKGVLHRRRSVRGVPAQRRHSGGRSRPRPWRLRSKTCGDPQPRPRRRPGDWWRITALRSRSAIAPPRSPCPPPPACTFTGVAASSRRRFTRTLRSFFRRTLQKLYQGEIAALEDAGCRYIQIDDPLLAYFISPRMRAEVQADGDDPDERLLRYVQLINDCVSKRKETTTIGLHICRGNARSLALSEGPYDGIAEQCFGHLAVDRFLLEYDDVHAGGFEPLRFMQPGKQVVLGLVTTKRPDLENKDALKRRVDEATRFVDAERLAISPQCGFASVVEGNAVSLDDEIAKLKLVVETAHELWGD